MDYIIIHHKSYDKVISMCSDSVRSNVISSRKDEKSIYQDIQIRIEYRPIKAIALNAANT